MHQRTVAALAAAFAAVVAGVAHAQPAPPAAAPLAPLAIPNPTYVTLVLETTVNRPADQVWARVGKYCAIGEWLGTGCEITSGVEGELGAVRRLRSGILEVMVAKTDLSYTYTQPVRVGAPYNLYHGTLEAKPVTPTTTRLVYSFVYDNSMLPDDVARAAEIANRRRRFSEGLQNMKRLAEGGSLPAARAR